ARRALPAAPSERLLAGLAVGLGLGSMTALGLAAAGHLRATPIAVVGAAVLVAGGRELARAGRALEARALGRVWPLVLVCALVLIAEVPAMLAPPVGGDQTKYQLVYPRLYALAGGLVPTPWSFWGQMQFLPNFVFALGFAASGGALARLLNGAMGVGAALLAVLAWRAEPRRRLAGAGLAFGLVVLVAAGPWYMRNAVETGNPIYPFGYSVFGGRYWSSAASEYLADYYRQYQMSWTAR